MPNTIDLRPAHMPITVYYKGDVSLQFSFTSGGSAYTLTDITAASFVISEKNGTAARTLSVGSGLTVNAAGGIITLDITHAQIVALATQEYNYEFSLTMTGGEVWPILDSVFNVSEDGQAEVTSSDVSVSIDGTNVDVAVIAPATSGGAEWGSITGTISNQTDLQTALNAKANTSHTHALSDLTQSGATSGQVAKWNGSAWAPANESGGGGHTIEDEGTPLTQRSTLNFVGAGVTATDAGGKTVVTIPGTTDGNGIYSGSGTIPDGTVASVASGGQFTLNYATGGLPAIWVIDGNSTEVKSPNGLVRMQVDNGQIELESNTYLKITAEGSSGTAGQVLTAQGDSTAIWADATGGGGASYTEITYADTQTAITGGTLTPGGWYLITDATGTDLGFLTHAVNESNISAQGVGGYLNADFQAAGDYSGVEAETGIAAGTQQGIWQAANEGGYAQGDVVIWNLLHYQLTDSGAVDGTDPATNTLAYTLLAKTIADVGYIAAWDTSEFDFPNAWLQYRADLRGNQYYYTKVQDDNGAAFGETAINFFQWGNAAFNRNKIDNGYIVATNALGSFYKNTLYPGAYINQITFADQSAEIGNNLLFPGSYIYNSTLGAGATILTNTLSPAAFIEALTLGESSTAADNIIENGGSIAGITAGANGQISRNKVGQGATLGGGTTMGDGASMNDNDLSSTAVMTGNTLDDGATMSKNALSPESEMVNNNIGSFAKMNGNYLQTLSYVGDNTLGGGSEFTENSFIYSGYSGKTLGDAVFIKSNVVIGVYAEGSETVSENAEFNQITLTASTYPATLDITGLTTIDFTAAFAQYRGIYNLTSSNATETLAADSLTNFPTLFPFRLVPASGLAVTLTTTAAASAVAGSIVGSAATIVLDGTNGDFVELEADPTGTFVRVKNLQVYV